MELVNFIDWIFEGRTEKINVKLEKEENDTSRNIIKNSCKIKIYKNELEHIKELNNNKLENVLFILLVLNKVNILNSIKLFTIFNLSKFKYNKNVKQPPLKTQRLNILNELVKTKYIEYNDEIKLNFDISSDEFYELNINNKNIENIVYFYEKYKGSKYIKKCEVCGEYFKIKKYTSNQKYCEKCSSKKQLKYQRNSMKKFRNRLNKNVLVGSMYVYGVIYKIENLANSKVYIGQTTKPRGFKDRYYSEGEGIERVYKYHKNRRDKGLGSYNSHLLKSIEKYGFKNFKVVEVFDIAFSKDELNTKEECWIKIYDSTNKNKGYNIKYGGGNYEVSEDSSLNDGIHIKCIDDGLEFRSISSASRYYGLSYSWVKNSFNKKHNIYNYINESPIFRKKSNKNCCCICGRTIKDDNIKICNVCNSRNRFSLSSFLNEDNIYLDKNGKVVTSYNVMRTNIFSIVKENINNDINYIKNQIYDLYNIKLSNDNIKNIIKEIKNKL